MEQQLKERLVGAVVVVTLGVLLIPQLLDGPAGPETPRTIGLELPAPEPGTRTHTIRLDEHRARPPVAAPARAPQPQSAPGRGSVTRPVVTEPESPPARRSPAGQPIPRTETSGAAAAPPPVAAPPPSETGEWAVQVGSFANPDNARRLSNALSREGHSAFVARLVTDGKTMHRVRVGPVDDRGAADALLQKLSRSGHSGRVVRMED